MSEENNLLSPVFLNDKEIKKLIELVILSHKDLNSEIDKVLEKIHFTRIYHRIIYFIAKKENITIKELLEIIQIPKQSLSRILQNLKHTKYININTGIDKRTKTLKLTQKGKEFEKELTLIQINKIKKILKDNDESDIIGFKKILYAMIGDEGKKIFNNLND